MYLFLLAFGTVLSVAGVALAASGLSVHDHTFDPTLVTPGIVAVVGGLLLIGLGFALRVLQRIEHALETRPMMPRALRAATAAESVAAGAAVPEAPGEPSRIPFPIKLGRPPQTAAAAAAAAVEKRIDELPHKFPGVVRAGPAPAPDDIEPSPKLPLPTALDDAEEQSAQGVGPFIPRALKARNGAAPPTKVSPRFDPRARSPLTAERPTERATERAMERAMERATERSIERPIAGSVSGTAGVPSGPTFDALWPKGLRPRRGATQAAPAAPEPAPEMPVVATEPAAEEQAASPAVAPEEAPEPVTILKSGIVDGMAYTLYSDGSIEAQLPQGLLRFGSITELRAHIEQDSQSS